MQVTLVIEGIPDAPEGREKLTVTLPVDDESVREVGPIPLLEYTVGVLLDVATGKLR